VREFRYRYGDQVVRYDGTDQEWVVEEVESDQAAQSRISELHIHALESGLELRTVYVRTTLKEAPSE
jgi:hypothetical protein